MPELDLDQPIELSLPAETIATIIGDLLNISGWKVNSGATHSGYLTAQLSERKELLGRRFDYNFRVVFRWQSKNSSQSFLSMRISESSKRGSFNHLKEKQLELITALIEEVILFDSRPSTEPNPEFYEVSKFAGKPALEKAGMLSADFDFDSKCFVITNTDEGLLTVPANATIQHVFVCGPTGSGKSWGIFAPNLVLRKDTSAIVTEVVVGRNDNSLYKLTAGYRSSHGHQIYYFNPDDPRSYRINPLDYIKTDRDARQIAALIMQTTTSKKHHGDQYWPQSEKMLLLMLILHAVGMRKEGKANLGYVRQLLDCDDSDLGTVLSNSPIRQARERYATFSSRGDERVRNIVIGALAQRLDLWKDELICRLTETTEIDVAKLPNELFTFYIATPSIGDHLQPLSILVWNYMLKLVVDNKDDFKYPLTLLLDEFANFGYIKNMQGYLTTIRHAGIGAIFGVQYLDQLNSIYHNEAKVFHTQPATKIYFTPNDPDDAAYLSNRLGRTTRVESVMENGRTKLRYHKRPLRTETEILQMPKWEMLVFLPNMQPIQMSCIHPSHLSIFTELEPPHRDPIDIDETLKVEEGEEQGETNNVDETSKVKESKEIDETNYIIDGFTKKSLSSDDNQEKLCSSIPENKDIDASAKSIKKTKRKRKKTKRPYTPAPDLCDEL